ncbi:MAG TPA: proton-conducting transporter membrane subunit, partial [Candidatus Limnocylindria bacterium]
MIQYVWLVPAFPLVAFLVNGLFGRRWLHHATGWIASLALAGSAVVAVGVFLQLLSGAPRTTVTLYQWIGVGDFKVNIAALVDPLSSVMMLVVTIVGTLIFIYANGYMEHDHGFHRFFTWFPLFAFAMLILVMADNYLLMFVGWEGVGLCSYLLIGFWFDKPAPQAAANKAFWMNRIGDWGYTIGMITTFLVFGSMTF